MELEWRKAGRGRRGQNPPARGPGGGQPGGACGREKWRTELFIKNRAGSMIACIDHDHDHGGDTFIEVRVQAGRVKLRPPT